MLRSSSSSSSLKSDRRESLLLSPPRVSVLSWETNDSELGTGALSMPGANGSVTVDRGTKVPRGMRSSSFASPGDPAVGALSKIVSTRGRRDAVLLLVVIWVRIESNAASLRKSVSSSSPDVNTRVSSEPKMVEAGSEAATECRLGRWRAVVTMLFESN